VCQRLQLNQKVLIALASAASELQGHTGDALARGTKGCTSGLPAGDHVTQAMGWGWGPSKPGSPQPGPEPLLVPQASSGLDRFPAQVLTKAAGRGNRFNAPGRPFPGRAGSPGSPPCHPASLRLSKRIWPALR
jgi:hypothetical protein